MLFPTIDFAIFFAVAFTANWLLNPYPRLWKLAMLAASYVFYSWWDWRFVFLLGAVTVTAIVGATVVARCQEERPRRLAMVAAVVVLLGILGWFKYYGFLAVNADNLFHNLRTAENIHDVDLPRHLGHSEQRRVSLLAQALLDSRVYRDDAISVALHVGRDTVAGTQRIAREADHGDGPGTLERLGDGV